MQYTFMPTGTCSKGIVANIENNCVTNVIFSGGCQGNLNAISKLIEGKSVDEVISLFKGNTCGKKPTSCTDQLAVMLEQIKSGELEED